MEAGGSQTISENLGFVTGGTVTVVAQMGGNMIVNIKDSRVAIGKDMANKIIVDKEEDKMKTLREIPCGLTVKVKN